MGVYSSATAQAVVASEVSCASFFVQSGTTNLACLEEGPEQNGTEGLPWKIADCQCFQNVETAPGDSKKSDYFSLSENINCEGFPFKPINNLIGVFDGLGKTVNGLSVEASDASVFRGYLGTLKNFKFNSLTLSAIGSQGTAALHFIDSKSPFVQEAVFSDIELSGIRFTADRDMGSAFGITNYLVGSISNVKVNGFIEASQAAGLVGESQSLRTEIAGNTQISKILRSNFAGSLAGKKRLGGIVLSNRGGAISDCIVAADLNFGQSWVDTGFQIGGIAAFNSVGGVIENCTVNGSANLNYVINPNATVTFEMAFGTLAAFNGYTAAGNPTYANKPGAINSCNSTMAYRAFIRANGKVPMLAVNDLIGESANGWWEGNSYLGTPQLDIVP